MTEEQQRIEAVNYDGGNILISASAGSGKTTLMIERICSLISSGKASVEQVLAVTFTDASAIDMKGKLRIALSKAINEGHKELSKQLNLISNSDITTIDSFCSKLVRKYFFEVGVNNDYKIIEPSVNEEYKKIALTNVFNKCYEEGGEFLDFVDIFAVKRNDNKLRETVLRFYNSVSTEADFDKAVALYESSDFSEILEIFTNYLIGEFSRFKDRFITLSQEFIQKKYDVGLKIVKDILSEIDKFLDVKDAYSLTEISLPKMPSSKKNEEDPFFLEKKSLSDLKNELSEFIRVNKTFVTDREKDEADFQNCKKTSSFIYSLTRKFKDEFTRLKLEDNYLDFNDIEHYAVKIIENESILKSLREKYKYIFVDEYQDVNATQEYILTRLSKDNLFMVGDDKQSIYGFRGCVPEFFQEKLVNMKRNGEKTVLLNTNFRSAKAVIDGVNQVFSYCMTEDRYGLDYSRKSKLVLCDKYGENYGRARLDVLQTQKPPKEMEEPRIYDIKKEALKEITDEDDVTVSMLYNIIQEELGQEFYDTKSKVKRKVMPKDIAILCRAKSGSEINGIIKGLTMRGLNITSTSEEDICEYPEVILCINILKLVDCFNQSVPLVSVLKSSIVGLDENELFEIVEFFKSNIEDNEKTNRRNFEFLEAFFYYLEHAETELKTRLKDFLNYIQKIRLASYYKTAGEILEEVIEDFSLFSYFYAEKDGEIKVKRIERLISFCNENVKSIQTLLNIVDSGKNKITIANGGNEDAIKFITMHSSKGLEFPVVIACRLNKQFNYQDKKNAIIFDRRFGLASKVFDTVNRKSSDGIFRKVIKIRYDEKIEKEEMRLFYVALTRATYSLHMQAIIEEDRRTINYRGAKTLFDFIPSTFETKKYTAIELKESDKVNNKNQVLLSQTTENGIKKIRDNLDFKYKYFSDILLPLKSNVTEANKNATEVVDSAYFFNDKESETSKVEQGIIAHRIMQYYDFSGEDFDSQISHLIDKNVLTYEQVKQISLEKIKKVINSSVFSSLKGKKIYREKPFIMEIKASEVFENINSEKKILLQGVIDLLAINGDEAEIIDYKYSSKNGEILKETYIKQLNLYAKAVTDILGIKHVKKRIVSLLTGDCVLID